MMLLGKGLEPKENCQDKIYQELTVAPYTPYTPPLFGKEQKFTVTIFMNLIDLLDVVIECLFSLIYMVYTMKLH